MRRAFDDGHPVGASKVFISARGRFTLSEQRDDRFRRIVRTAEFARVDGGEPVPPLRNAEVLHWAGDCLVVTGVEEVSDGNLSRPRLCAQSWQLVPEPYEDLMRADRHLSRLATRLHQLGVDIEILPGGEMRIPGETWPDGPTKGRA